MRTITTAERLTRLGHRHHLAVPSTDVATVAADLTGLHSSDPATVFLSARARVADFDRADLEHVLYEQRALLRLHGMRKTMFVVDHDFARPMLSATVAKYLPTEVRRWSKFLEEHNAAGDGAAFIERLIDQTATHLRDNGPAFARDLSDAVPELATKFVVNHGKNYEGTIGLSTRILWLAAASGHIARGRPKGRWIGSQYEWHEFARWAGYTMEPLDPAAARAAILRRWLGTYGPGTLTDITWWSGLGKRDMTAALRTIEAVEVDLEDGGTGWVLADDTDEVAEPDDWVALLPSLDQALMGWKEREWFLGDLGAELFDRNGNAGQTIMWNGRVVGGWTHQKSGRVHTDIMCDVPKRVHDEVGRHATRLEEWMDGTVVTPRFASPFDKGNR